MRAKPLTFARARKLRAGMSLPEIILWHELRSGRLHGMRFRRQHPVGSYILDFYCPAACLAVEVDGGGHDFAEQVKRDRRRDAWLATEGIRVVRVLAADILNDKTLEGVLQVIAAAASSVGPNSLSVGFADSSPVNGGAPELARVRSSPVERGRGTAEGGGGGAVAGGAGKQVQSNIERPAERARP
jgi:very-short-patch-repair endonuclease